MKLLVINGPNLNMLGVREPNVYGAQTYAQLLAFIEQAAKREGVDVECFQSNHEGAIVDRIQAAYGTMDGIIINPGGYSHTSVAILDALKAVALPTVEVHLTDISKREPFRRFSYTAMACEKSFIGLGFQGYAGAIRWLKARLA